MHRFTSAAFTGYFTKVVKSLGMILQGKSLSTPVTWLVPWLDDNVSIYIQTRAYLTAVDSDRNTV